MIRTLALIAAALATSAACAPAYAGPSSARPLVDIDVVDRDTGEWLPEYRHRGQTWIPGTPGHRYSLRLINNTGERLLVVVSVDGVNAVSGETAGAQQTGYVLGPWQTTEVSGWRKSLREVAQFYFTDLPDSYAARTGRPDNVGVIGAAVFRERQRYVPYEAPAPIARDDRYGGRAESERRAGAAEKSAPAPQASRSASAGSAYESDAAGQRIGTGHGEREWSPVGRTRFERASRSPAEVVQLRYDDVPNLVALGVMPWPHRRDDRRHRDRPQAFPNGFAADPPRW